MKTKQNTLILVLLFILSTYAFPQWVPTAGPNSGDIRCFAMSGSTIFAGIEGNGVWKRSLSEMLSPVAENQPTPNNLLVYPNPVTNLLTIKNQKLKEATLIITNSFGKIVYKTTSKYLEDTFYIHFSEFPSGAYYIKVIYRDGTSETVPFVKI